MKNKNRQEILLNDYLNKVDNLLPCEFNDGQKELVKLILELVNKEQPSNLQNAYQFLINRIKLGFRFDAAPDVPNKDKVIILEKDKTRSFKLDNQKPQNQLIIGENYDALKALNLIEDTKHKSQNPKYDVIYIDPPYNTEATKEDGNGRDYENTGKFVYKDKFTQNGWLNMMNDRLILARDLLKKDGVIFVSIDDTEQAYLKVLMDGIFGEENFITSFIWQRTFHSNKNNNGKKIFRNAEYIHVYSKNSDSIKFFNEGEKTNFCDAPLKNHSNSLKKLKFPINSVYYKQDDAWNNEEIVIEFKSRWNQEKINSEFLNGTTYIRAIEN
ncbi:site-specific DNA-methyltransferase [Mycoplasma sp. Pen4]|uniref:DNA methyltransferase n=1 Tax=Mycoplasma sp. Pen4 TaxID=640330 RepID=UPI001653FEE7|nr:site-specific DNA-methyltransferase [Mycoplasma sp. Pen4]QNM93468.1 site-specific DNA-methyltransferase [Mycoplasma sp. Pen4]